MNFGSFGEHSMSFLRHITVSLLCKKAGGSSFAMCREISLDTVHPWLSKPRLSEPLFIRAHESL